MHAAEDQWPPVQFQEYIKLTSVLKMEDFMKEDYCIKAMMKGKLGFVKRHKKAVPIEKVSYWQLHVITSEITHSMIRLAGWRMVHWLAASLWKGFLELASPP